MGVRAVQCSAVISGVQAGSFIHWQCVGLFVLLVQSLGRGVVASALSLSSLLRSPSRCGSEVILSFHLLISAGATASHLLCLRLTTSLPSALADSRHDDPRHGQCHAPASHYSVISLPAVMG